MKTYFVKQKFRLGGERFDIKDDQGRVAYQVEGSFFKIPKTFTIFGEDGREISHITKEPLSLLPKFTVDLRDGSSFYIRKKLTFLRDKYDVDNLGFQLLNSQNQVVARIQKELFHLTSTYTVTVYENTYADLAISLCVAIDYVEMLENSSK